MDSSHDAKIEPDIKKIERSLDEGIDDEQPYSISTGILFRPQDSILKNLEKVNYLGKCKVVAGMDQKDTFAGFSGRREKVCAFDYGKDSKIMSVLPIPTLYYHQYQLYTTKYINLTIGNDILK
jgi:hypothetical protein